MALETSGVAVRVGMGVGTVVGVSGGAVVVVGTAANVWVAVGSIVTGAGVHELERKQNAESKDKMNSSFFIMYSPQFWNACFSSSLLAPAPKYSTRLGAKVYFSHNVITDLG